MIEINIVLEFPLVLDKKFPRFKMQIDSMPKVGDYIGKTDAVFGPRYNDFYAEICRKYPTYNGHPQFVRSIGHTNCEVTAIVGCDPANVLTTWHDHANNCWNMIELSYLPRVGDLVNIGDQQKYVASVCIDNDNLITVRLCDTYGVSLGDVANNVEQIKSSVEMLEQVFSRYDPASIGESVVDRLRSIEYTTDSINDRISR